MNKSQKRLFSRALSVALSVFLAFGCIVIGGTQANADDSWYVSKTNAYVGQKDEYISTIFMVYNSDTGKEAVPQSIKSSNKKILKIKSTTYEGQKDFYYTAKKPGKVKLTGTFKTPDGAIITKKATIKVKKYPKMIKSFKLNGKSVKLSKHKFYYNNFNYGKNSAKIKIVPKKGWKIGYVSGYMFTKKGKEKKIKGLKKKIKNGQSISFPKKYVDMSINVELRKGKEYVWYNILLVK